MWLEMESYVWATADARAGPTARSREGANNRTLAGSKFDGRIAAIGPWLPPTRCAKPSPGGRAKSLRGENIRKNWVYTPAGWKSQLDIRRKSFYHGITNFDLSPAERWGAVERPALS